MLIKKFHTSNQIQFLTKGDIMMHFNVKPNYLMWLKKFVQVRQNTFSYQNLIEICDKKV